MSEPTCPCPYCSEECFADWVDVGFGPIGVQCGPFHCDACGASQIGPCDEPRDLTEDEKRTHWYGPNTPPGSSANTIGGVHIDHKTALGLYRLGIPLDGDR